MQEFFSANTWAAIQTFILAVTAVILVWEISELRKATAMEGFNTLAALLNSTESVEARKLLYKKKDDLESLSSKKFAPIEKVIVLLDQLGCLINRNLIPEREAIEMYWDVVIKCWDSSESLIKKQRRIKRLARKKLNPNKIKKGIKPSKSRMIFNASGLCSNWQYKKLRAAVKYNRAIGFKLYPKLKPNAKDYAATHYENFEMLVWRCERYCKKRKLDRPIVF
jgi:hypothetical protein